MLFIAICALVGVLVGVLYAKRYTPKDERTYEYTFYSIMGFLVGMVPAGISGKFLPTKEIVVSTSHLQSMRSESSIEGYFFLLGGSIEGTWEYRYYIKLGDGSLSPQTLNVGKNAVRIIEDDDSVPRLDMLATTYASEWSWVVAWPESPWDSHYLFTVPKGSVVQEFRL